MVNIVFWLGFGTIVGWVAAIIGCEPNSRRSLAYIVAGCIGGLTGGLVSIMLSPGDIEYAMQANGITFAVFGAIAFVVLARFADNKNLP